MEKPKSTGKFVTVELTNTTCEVFKGQYTNNRTALILYERESGEEYAIASTNLPDENIDPKYTFIKDYGENEGILDALIAGGIVGKPISKTQSGWVEIPLCEVLV